jgi:hypothetical protein
MIIGALLQPYEPRSMLERKIATITSDHIIAIIRLDVIVAFDSIVAFMIPLVALITSTPIMWREFQCAPSTLFHSC